MNRNRTKQILLMLCVIFSITSISSCVREETNLPVVEPEEYYTCSMDPQVIESKPGNCPICHMKLIKVKKHNLMPGQLKLSAQQIKLANITYDTLTVGELAKEITLNGVVAVDQTLTEAISAKVQGRIEKLAVKNVGDYITKGQLLYEIYSEELNIIQQEYILSLQRNASIDGFRESAINKMLLYGMSEAQILQIKTSKVILQSVPVYSTAEGFVTELSVSEGGYVTEGATLFRLASLQSLWIESQIYLSYLRYISIGSSATISIASASEKTFSGKVVFINPEIQSPERFVLARFQILNPSEVIKPSMLANITIKTEKKKGLLLPVEAVIQDSKGASVWVRNSDGIFENKMVTVGMQNSRQVEIIEGLEEGDVVVVSGVYLLNSEYIFKKGANPMEGHNMPGMKM
ncbi:MAG: efflux RND transporter periplasmic adaptor subunit [Bacteroidetes bacterium]|nr:efflux RND transporter periplasmic adaptor subunit [Bacteroidota bacterium]